MGEGADTSRNWTTIHFLVFDGRPSKCHGASGASYSLLMLYDAYTEAQGLVEVDLSAILDPSSVYVVSLGHVILSKDVPCPPFFLFQCEEVHW